MSNAQNKTILHTEQLQHITHKLSRQIIEITTNAGSGHPSSSLSMIDILTVLYFGDVMNHAPQEPHWAERDRFILSKGHGAPGLYVTLAEAGYFDNNLIYTLRETGSPLEGHPNMRALPGVEASTGSLGQGLSIGIGHALAARVDKLDYRVYVLIGDGEADEGQIWEAALSAAKFKLDNLTCILDYNQFQQTGAVHEVMPSMLPFAEKWQAFGWDVKEIDGHDIPQIKGAFAHAKTVKNQPQVIVAHTKKGKGLSPFEDDDTNRMHGKALTLEQTTTALQELDRMYNSEEV
ncbi:MAG: transketolase [Anaerolineae bacterium]